MGDDRRVQCYDPKYLAKRWNSFCIVSHSVHYWNSSRTVIITFMHVEQLEEIEPKASATGNID